MLDAAIVVAIGAVVESLAWSRFGPGEHIEGPQWLTASLPLLLALPLWWRRRRPLLVMVLVASGVMAQALSAPSAEGLEIVAALGIAAYSVAAYGSRRRAVLGLGVLLLADAVHSMNDTNTRSGRASELWATAFFALFFVGCWVAGAWLRSRRESERNALRASALEHEAALAVTAERARVARELHDIVAHNLSVVVLQAAGARAQRGDDGDRVHGTLEKIESSGREALVEMRRMLEVLRAEDGSDVDLAPQPGLDRLTSLVEGVRRAGLDVDLTVESSATDVSPALALTAYRIVQESLTNALKHAGHARVAVRVRRDLDALVVEVTDDGAGTGASADGSGHGLVGMRERAALLGGTLEAGPLPGGGFGVRARLPLGEPTP